MTLLESLNWRYATKRFNPERKLTEEQLQLLKQAVKLSASSYGLQLYKVLFISNAELREKLKSAAWNQPQITEASHLVVFCNYTHYNEQQVDDYIQRKSDVQNIELTDLESYGEFMKKSLSSRSEIDYFNWTVRQPYIALGNLLAACGELKIDACPMEGFVPEKFNEILGLNEKGLNAAVLATIGYRSHEDKTQHLPKVRKTDADLFEMLD